MFSIKKGQIIIYRVFDIGEEVILSKVREQLKDLNTSTWHIKENDKKSIIVNNPPLFLKINKQKFTLKNQEFESDVSVKIWDYGVCSISFIIDINDMKSSDLISIRAELDKETSIDKKSKEILIDLFFKIKDSIIRPKVWDKSEDYTITLAQSITLNQAASSTSEKVEEIEVKDPSQLNRQILAKILIGETSDEELSDYVVEKTLNKTMQYGKKDMVVIDWNSAFVVEPSGSMDIPDILEFVLTHQLEIQFYNSILEIQKQSLYQNSDKNTHLFNLNNMFSSIALQANQRFLEFSDLIRKVDNSIETIGDKYLALVLRTANLEFNQEIRATLNTNMRELKDQAETFSNKVHTIQELLLSTAITIMILFELIMKFF